MNAKAIPNVYSYIRFSTPEQRKGTGHKRQTNAAEEWCRKNGLPLFKNYSDLGVSAFKGKNAEHGELSAFLKLVNAGRIPPGSILLVESLDRLSRQNVNKALELFLSIINADIEIVTLVDGARYSANSDPHTLMSQMMISLAIFIRANDESRTKSQRKTASWQFKRDAARESGKPVGSRLPRWIRLVSGQYELIPQEANLVRAVFQDYVNGMGWYTLHNKYQIPQPTLAYWMTHPIVIGTLRVKENGHYLEIPNHYPPVIDVETWTKAQAAKAKRHIARRKGRTGSINLFTGLLFDPHGHTMTIGRYNGGTALYHSPGYTLNVRIMELCLCGLYLQDHFVKFNYAAVVQPNPALAKLKQQIAIVQNEMTDTNNMVEALIPVLRNLQKQKTELESEQQKAVAVKSVDYGLIEQLLLYGDDKQARLQLRDIVSDTVKSIKLTRVENENGNGWWMAVEGLIELRDGTTEPFGYVYCSRNTGFIQYDPGQLEWPLSPEIKKQLRDFPLRKMKAVDADAA